MMSRFKREHDAPKNHPMMLQRYPIHFPPSILECLEQKSIELGQPMSKLVVLAVDEALRRADGFDFGAHPTGIPFVEHAYDDEAVKLFDYLKNFKSGTSLDLLILCRRDFGIENPGVVRLAYRELLHAGMIEEYYPHTSKFRYPKEYRYIRIVQDIRQQEANRRRYKMKPQEVIK